MAGVTPGRVETVTQLGILDELRKLSLHERLAVIESAVRLIRDDLGRLEQPADDAERRRLAEAAAALLADYSNDPELTVFTALDAQDFDEKG